MTQTTMIYVIINTNTGETSSRLRLFPRLVLNIVFNYVGAPNVQVENAHAAEHDNKINIAHKICTHRTLF